MPTNLSVGSTPRVDARINKLARKKDQLPATRVQEMWCTYLASGDPYARQELLEHYLPLVRNVAGRMALGFPKSVEVSDLVSTGVLGLIEALKNFDPTRGVKFETFAVPRIRGAILDEIRELDWIPRSTRAKARAIERARIRLENQLLRPPTRSELAKEMELNPAELDDALEEVSGTVVLSLDELVYREEDNRQVPRVETVANPSNHDPLFPITQKETLEAIKSAIREFLDTQEFFVIWMYYIDEMTLAEIGEALRVSESRVSQIHTHALELLKGIFSSTEQWNFEGQ